MAKLKVGIVGAGSIADLHAIGYERDDRADIVAVCDTNEDRAVQRSLDWGASTYYNNFDEMLAAPNIDAIEILTPNHLHAAQAIKALRAGKHVSVERPIALTIEEATQVMREAEQAKRMLHVYEPCLYYKPLLDARNLIDAGEIGKPTGIRIAAVVGQSEHGTWDFGGMSDEDAWRFDPQRVGGTPMLHDVGYQAFCIALFLIGSVEKIEVWRAETPIPDSNRKIDAPTTGMWKHFQQDVFGSLALTYAPERVMRSTYFPLEFTITVSGTRGDLQVLRSSDTTSIDSPVELRRNNRRVIYGQKSTTFEDSFVRATQNFISACLGEEEPLLRGQEAKQLLVLTLAYFESARRGRAIPLHYG